MIQFEGGGGGGCGGGQFSGGGRVRVAKVFFDEPVAPGGERGPAPVVRRMRQTQHAAGPARAGQLRQAARPVSIE